MTRAVTRILIIPVSLMLHLLTSCEEYIATPVVGDTVVSRRTVRGAYVESEIIWDGGDPVKECGFCWNTTGTPNIGTPHVKTDEAGGKFSCLIDTLRNGTYYYIRAYAKNSKFIGYGPVKAFTTEAFRLPEIVSPSTEFVGHNSVIFCGGSIIDNTNKIISKGICWSTSINPTINDTKLELEENSLNFYCIIEGLMPGTVYYFRAYATNIVGTTYGNNRIIRTFDGYITDYEGIVYSTVRLGNQEWFNRNSETRYFSNGDKINTTFPAEMNLEQEDKPVYQWVFRGLDDKSNILDDYGRLYTWYAATDNRKICPAGWHLPLVEEWNELIDYLGEYFRSCYRGRTLNTGITEGGFCPQAGAGFREVTGLFQYGYSEGSYWWTATEASSENAYAIFFTSSNPPLVVERNKKHGYSVRCIKD